MRTLISLLVLSSLMFTPMISQASTTPNTPSRVIAPRAINPLIGTWNITSYDAHDLTGVTVTFGRNSYQAKFCNNLNGRYRVVQNRVITTSGMSTMMACADQNLMNAESYFSTVRSWTQGKDGIMLETHDGHTYILKR